MKQHFFMRGGFLLAVMAAFLTFFACKHDLQIEPVENASPKTMPAEIKAAKDWFDNNQMLASSKFKGMKPQWSQAISTAKEVEVPFLIQGKVTIPTLYQQGLAHLGKQRLTIYTKSDGQKEAFIFDIMPIKTFSGSMKEVNSVNFKIKQFTGLVAIRNILGENVSTYQYENGKATKKLNAKTNTKDKGDVTLRADVCHWVEYQYNCGTVCVGDVCGEPQCDTAEYFECYDDGSGNGNGGDDPCNSGSPPPYCDGGGGDPCNGPNPPPNCGGGDPCSRPNPPPNCGGDPCDGPNPPASCDKCPSKPPAFGVDKVGTFSYFPFGFIDFAARMSNVDIKAGTYTLPKMQHQLRNVVPAAFSFTSEESDVTENEFDASTCTRTISVTYYGDITITLREKFMAYEAGHTDTRNYEYHYTWSFN